MTFGLTAAMYSSAPANRAALTPTHPITPPNPKWPSPTPPPASLGLYKLAATKGPTIVHTP